jgi:hypothetical protein
MTLAPSVSATSQSADSPAISSDKPTGWVWKGADPGFQSSFYHGPIAIDTSIGMCRFVFDEPHKTTSIECFRKDEAQRLWGFDEGHAFVDDAVLVADADHLYVARYSNISSGCDVIAYELKSGNEAWRMSVLGLGPIAHSEYLNSVEMRLTATPQKLEVFGWESAGKYVETIDLASGATISTRRIDSAGNMTPVPIAPKRERPDPPHPGEALKAKFEFGKTQPKMMSGKGATVKLANGVSCTLSFDAKGDRESLACVDASSKRLWAFDLADQFVGAGALVADEKGVYVANYCAISDGATVLGYDAQTGKPRWRTSLVGLGPVDHSKYSNVVAARLERGHIVVSGWESSGKYVEVLDPLTGEDLGNRKEP